jgi:hypothetical protein
MIHYFPFWYIFTDWRRHALSIHQLVCFYLLMKLSFTLPPVPKICPMWMKTAWQLFIECSNIKFNENQFIDSQVVPCAHQIDTSISPYVPHRCVFTIILNIHIWQRNIYFYFSFCAWCKFTQEDYTFQQQVVPGSLPVPALKYHLLCMFK